MMHEAAQQLDRLVQTLQTLVNQSDPPRDAIDRILADSPRRTNVRSLGDDPTVQRFREDLTNGLIRVDTANALFGLITEILSGVRGMS